MKVNDQLVNKELVGTALLIKTFVPSFSKGTLPIARNLMNLIKGKCNLDLFYEEVYIKRADGTDLRLTIYAPKNRIKNAPGILWMHGGGYGLGIPEMNDKFFKKVIDETNAIIISPDYTLSFEAPYPAAINDCYLALEWMKNNTHLYDINPNQLMIGGESAGGGLTACLSLMARDKKEINIAYQMPLYPMLDDRMILPSAINNEDPVWDSVSNLAAWKVYLNDLFGTDLVSKYASPLRETDFSGLPPTFTYVGSLEVFRDETIEYVDRLLKVENRVVFRLFDGVFHAFDSLSPHSLIATEAFELLIDNLKYAIENYFKENKV